MERLASSGELEASQQRHVDFVLKLASQLEATFASDAERSRFHSEQDNFRAALAWTEEVGDTESQLELIGRSWPFWWYRGHSAEGLRWVESALANSEGERSLRRAKVLAAGAMFAYRSGQPGTMKSYAAESLEIARNLGDARNTTWPLIFLGLAAYEVGNYDEARNSYEKAITVARETGDRKLVGIVINNLGVLAMQQADFVRAARLFEEALAISRELRTPDEMALETLNLAWCLLYTGRSAEAVEAAKQGLALAHETENLTSLDQGFVLLGALACQQGNAHVAARLLGAAETIRERAGDVLGGADEDLETTVKAVMNELGQDRYTEALAEGHGMSVDKAVEYGLTSVD